jgi:hypothetical protein
MGLRWSATAPPCGVGLAASWSARQRRPKQSPPSAVRSSTIERDLGVDFTGSWTARENLVHTERSPSGRDRCRPNRRGSTPTNRRLSGTRRAAARGRLDDDARKTRHTIASQDARPFGANGPRQDGPRACGGTGLFQRNAWRRPLRAFAPARETVAWWMNSPVIHERERAGAFYRVRCPARPPCIATRCAKLWTSPSLPIFHRRKDDGNLRRGVLRGGGRTGWVREEQRGPAPPAPGRRLQRRTIPLREADPRNPSSR